ncbi:MAG: transposase [Flavobacteriales bacterium]|nr:transposase [Flavobacteriales bacterium]MBK7940322.1 transposase [Flavobacteriales bacterium]MBK9699518.1 transposase [Flavobacteriales bacterium]
MAPASPTGSDFKIKFDGQQHQVDANVLISSLIHTTAVVQEVNRSLNSGKKIEIKVKALEPGSFLVHIELVEKAVDSLRVHHSQPVQDWVEEHDQEIELFFLPSYSPELNPVEIANADLR